MKRFLAFCAAVSASGCSHVDTGQVDYRVADAPAAITDPAMGVIKGNRCVDDVSKGCDPILPSRVIRRYMPNKATGWDAMKKDQVYSIDIEQGMVGDNILEGKILGGQYGRTAEIAVLANVFEFASEAGDAASRRFLEGGELAGKSDDPSDVELKLVYFGDDVERHQAFNFSNIPLRARSAYGGGSVGIQLVVMEVDAQAGPVASLLKTLARFGQQALPVPGEAKDILFDLGESLLSGSQDDKLLEYRFVLSAGGEDARAVQATFAPGRYVVRRMQQRGVDMKWSTLRLDHNTGRLYREIRPQTPAPAAGDVVSPAPGDLVGSASYAEVRDDLYLVLNVRRYPDGTKPEYYAQKDWSTFRDALQAAADTKAAPLDKVTERLVSVLADGRSTDWRDGLLLKWATVGNRFDLYSARYAKDFANVATTACAVSAIELQRRLDSAEREALNAVREFRAEYQLAAAAKRRNKAGEDVGDEFKLDERERVVTAAAAYFMPWTTTGASQPDFADATAFQKAFVDGDSTGDLAATGLAAARAKAAPAPTCADLLAK